MQAEERISQLQHFRKMVRLFTLVQTFFMILLAHLSVVFGVYLIIKSRSNSTAGSFILGTGVVVVLCGLLVSVLWRFLAKLATEGMLILAEIADGLSSNRDGFRNQKHGTRQNLQG
jgi:hypothetical protein